MNSHETYMREALEQARLAADADEAPIGAVAVVENAIVARAYNIREKSADPLGHAEILLLRELAKQQGDWRLEDATIYVTLEPCIMCMGALLQARVPRLVFGASDPKAGAAVSLYRLGEDKRLNHQIEIVSGVLAEECGAVLKEFFKKLR